MVVNPSEAVSEAPVIELRGVTLDYGMQEVVQQVDLKVRRGESKVILGPSGVGKSTILRAALGLMKPKAGEVYLHGMGISKLPGKELVKIRLRMAMVFQHSALFDSMSVGDNVSYRLREHAMADEETMEKRVREVLRFVGLEGAVKLKPSQLSGGMRKRVAIARALAPEPGIFLFDEPTTGLDPINHYNTEQLIIKLRKKTHTTLVIVTHDVESACRLADTIVVLHQGKFIFEGTPEELKQNPDPRVQEFLDPARGYHESI